MSVKIINPLSTKQNIEIVLRSPFRARALKFYLVAILIFIYRTINDPEFIANLESDLLLVSMLVLAGLLIRKIPLLGPPIQLMDQQLRLPHKAGSSKYEELPYSKLRSFEVRGRGRSEFIVIDTPSRTIAYPRTAFPSAILWQVFIQEVLGRIAELEGGGRQLVEMEHRSRMSRAVLSRRPLATMIFLATMAIVFCFELIFGSAQDPIWLAGWGANSAVLVHEGQWYRLVSSGFLHLGFLHFALNFVAFFSLGYLIEAMLGKARFLIIFCGSLLSASYASVLSGHALSVGISGAVFGLLGALAFLQFSLKELPAGFRMTSRWWFWVLVINGSIPVLVPGIDMAAHLGGFISGAILTGVLRHSRDASSSATLNSPSTFVDICGVVAALILIWGVASAVFFGSDPEFRSGSVSKIMSVKLP